MTRHFSFSATRASGKRSGIGRLHGADGRVQNPRLFRPARRSIGTDAQCRPVLAGQLYDPFSTQQVTATCAVPSEGVSIGQTVQVRDPIVGNMLSNASHGIDPVGLNLIGFYPQPLHPTLLNNWAATGVGANPSNEYTARIDHNFTDQTRIYGRFSDKHESKQILPPFYGANDAGGPGQIDPNNRWNVALGVTHSFTSAFLMTVNLGVMRWVEGNNMQSAGFKPSWLGLPSFIDPNSAQFPVINVPSGYAPLGPVQGAGQGAFPRNIGSSSLDFVKVKGQHSLSFGYAVNAIDENGGRIQPTIFNFDNNFTLGPDITSTPLNSPGMSSHPCCWVHLPAEAQASRFYLPPANGCTASTCKMTGRPPAS